MIVTIQRSTPEQLSQNDSIRPQIFHIQLSEADRPHSKKETKTIRDDILLADCFLKTWKPKLVTDETTPENCQNTQSPGWFWVILKTIRSPGKCKTSDYIPSRHFLYQYGTLFYYYGHNCILGMWLVNDRLDNGSHLHRQYLVCRIEFIARRQRHTKMPTRPIIFGLAVHVSIFAWFSSPKRPCVIYRQGEK